MELTQAARCAQTTRRFWRKQVGKTLRSKGMRHRAQRREALPQEETQMNEAFRQDEFGHFDDAKGKNGSFGKVIGMIDKLV